MIGKIYIGIDNGLDGGVGAVDQDGNILRRERSLTIKTGKGREYDATQLDSFIQKMDLEVFDERAQIVIAAEKAQIMSRGIMAVASTWFTWGMIYQWLKRCGHRYQTVNPKEWQKEFWVTPKMPKGTKFDTKAAALNAARRIWPHETFHATDRSSTPHDGIVDALLIAEWARRRGL